MEDLIPIGQFAAASRLSPKALRLYDENGLLPPACVDPDSRYRYYRLEQLDTATTIRLLRGCGMPLAEIRAFLSAPSDLALGLYERSLADELVERRRILRYLRHRLKEEPMFEVRTKHVEEQPYASRTKRVHVADLDPFIESTIDELRAEHDASGPPFTLYHGTVDQEADGPVEVCLPTVSGERTLPAAEVAYTTAAGEDAQFPAVLGAYDAVARWAKQQKRELDGSPREIYVGPPTGPDARLEIAWPIR
jgi:DNA-binding transcriptional MerR regulator